MATVQLLPIYQTISRKLLRRTARNRSVGDFEVVEGFDRIWLALSCPTHAWTWPRTNKEECFGGYDAHQTCHKCRSRRMFDTQQWQSGPIYKLRGDPRI